ncbi:MAG TPA: sigma-70 family RNA polymerase sigma factor [Bacteroidia bacterium]|jgi:RNA polymerase sigma-70 factor (ECF subfamily)|nr:sigma-70 family RNA polymerase sigma factor [Bacteroidia bacterium]
MLNPQNWVSNYGDYLYSIAMMKTSNTTVAEDLVQDTFLSAIKAADGFKGDSSEKTWLVKILNNKIIDYYRKKDVLKGTTDYLDSTEASFDDHYFEANSHSEAYWKKDAMPDHWKSDADSSLNQAEFNKVLEFCMQKLPSKLLPVFVLKYIDDEDADKICKELDISSSNYWVIIHRAKLLMRACLEKNWLLNGGKLA